MQFIIVLLALLISSNSFSAFDSGAWNGWNDPMKIDSGFETNMSKLPLEGSLVDQSLAWPGYYWANNRGGIAQRWRAKRPMDFKYRSPGLSELYRMDSSEINEMSPAEKYDILMGRYDYPTVQRVWRQTREGHRDWYGICHGVSPSSLHHPEPKTKTLVNPDGVSVTFFSSDLKALLAYHYAKVSESESSQVGKRCFVPGWLPVVRNYDGCTDVNPGALHVIMANTLGIEGKGFIADMDRYSPVWNHAARRYESQVLGSASPARRSAPGTVKRLKVSSLVTFTANVDPSDERILSTEKAKWDRRKYVYWLDLDFSGRIVGGEWISGDRPDFVWVKKRSGFKGYWSELEKIVD